MTSIELLKGMKDNARELIKLFSARNDRENQIIELLGFCDIIDTWIEGVKDDTY